VDGVVDLIRRSGAERLVVLDLETTGLGGDDRIVEIAMLSIGSDGRHGARFDSLIDPERAVNARAAQVNGLDSASLAGAPKFASIAGDVAAFLTGACIVAHNAKFDVGFLTAEFARVGVRLNPGRPIDTLRVTGMKLEVALAHHGIRFKTLHRAMADVEATAELLARIARSAPAGRPLDVTPKPPALRTRLRPREVVRWSAARDDDGPRHLPGERVGPRPGSRRLKGGASVDISDPSLARSLEPVEVSVLLSNGSHIVISTLTDHSKAEIIDHAEALGLVVKPEVTHSTIMLVTDDLHSPSRRALKARGLGVPFVLASDLLTTVRGGTVRALGDAARVD
jgi:DNA polymerase III epsilon subunit family exonuclease